MPKKKKEPVKFDKFVLTKKKEKLSMNNIKPPNAKPKKPEFIKNKSSEERKVIVEPQQQFEEPPTQFRRIALEELTTEDISGKDLGQGTRWIRTGSEEKKEEKESAIYDLAKATKSNYSSVGDSYQLAGTGGDYDSIQRAGQTTPGFQDPNRQNNAAQMDQTKSYDTSQERELKERRKLDRW